MPINQVQEHIRKVAVLVDGHETQFLELDQQRPLAAVVKDLCDLLALDNTQNFALKTDGDGQHKTTYITERNRVEIKNGHVLRLASSPSKTAEEIYEKLMDGAHEELPSVLGKLTKLSGDPTFASEFILINGLQLIVKMVNSEGYSPKSPNTREILAYLLKSFVELMDHGTISWDVLEKKFIEVVSNLVSNHKVGVDAVALQSSLEILESIVLHSSMTNYAIVQKEVTVQKLTHHLSSNSQIQIQKGTIALINAMFQRAEPENRKKIAEALQSRTIRDVIRSNVIRTGAQSLGNEMAHQLYVLQSLLFNQLEERMHTSIEQSDQNTMKEIMDLRMIAFDSDIPIGATINQKKQSNFALDYKKLGFKNHANPAQDFMETPPGILALDVMVFFARNHAENYTKVVLENSCRLDEHDCPFARASVELTKMLCEILKVGEPPHEEGQTYYPMFFTNEKPFEEFYCLCIALLNKTWKEMKAAWEDFHKVLSVVKEQITRALESLPQTFDQFKNKLNQLTYAEITNMWQQERVNKEEWESQAKPIVELREQIKPEILELIKEQRLNYLVEGTLFQKYNNGKRVKDKHIYCRLSPTHKVFHFGDCDENAQPTIDLLPNKLSVVDIKSLMVGSECPLISSTIKRGKSTLVKLAFSIMPDVGDREPLNFVSPNEYDYCVWTDGINALLGNEMVSDQTTQDLEILLGMEIKLRLLDTEGITIPETPPPIPDDPPNYDFAYNY
ncbi:engulfment and cell motility protein 1-like isoform X2 [Lineus longissimus]|uniref:engulfment and cell motility protein 1-like isoform X2 n=1 Tax=Lineus longissimus TaxID=88925 RepID=UPI002B4F59CA